jgi:hypothetical protein
MDSKSIHDVLVAKGYKLVDDAWTEFGRRTYIHEDDARRAHIRDLTAALRARGWETDTKRLRAFRRPGELIEVEPGGADTSGHFLHQMRERPGVAPRGATAEAAKPI